MGRSVTIRTDLFGVEGLRRMGRRPMSVMGPGCSLTRGLAVKLSVMRPPGSLFSPRLGLTACRPFDIRCWG